DRGDPGAEGHGLGEDPGHQVFAVVHPGKFDRAPEHVREQQHEHDRLDGAEDQQVGYPLDLDQVALGDDPAVGHREYEHAHAPLLSSSLVVRPVNWRNTSSSVGRRTPMSATLISAVSSWRTASVSART